MNLEFLKGQNKYAGGSSTPQISNSPRNYLPGKILPVSMSLEKCSTISSWERIFNPSFQTQSFSKSCFFLTSLSFSILAAMCGWFRMPRWHSRLLTFIFLSWFSDSMVFISFSLRVTVAIFILVFGLDLVVSKTELVLGFYFPGKYSENLCLLYELVLPAGRQKCILSPMLRTNIRKSMIHILQKSDLSFFSWI